MIIIIIFAACLIMGILLSCLNNKYWFEEAIDIIGFILIFASIFGLGVCLISIIVSHLNTEARLHALQNTRDMLVYRLEHINELPIGNEMLYSEIAEFNNWLYTNIINSQNPWINWFYNSAFNNIPLIPWQ